MEPPQHHRPLLDWLERSGKVLQDWEDWKKSLDPGLRRTLGLNAD